MGALEALEMALVATGFLAGAAASPFLFDRYQTPFVKGIVVGLLFLFGVVGGVVIEGAR